MYVNKWQETVTAAFLDDDLTGYLFTMLWPLVVIWVYKMVYRSCVGQRPLCKSQIVKLQESHRQLTVKAGDQLEEVTVKAVSTVSLASFY